MVSPPRTAAYTILLCVAAGIFTLCSVLIAGWAAGDGTILVELGEDKLTQEDSSVTFTPWVSYNGSSSLFYQWDFGDGTVSSSERPTKTYTKAGDYNVTLTVVDGDGVEDSDTIKVTVLNVRPIADAGSDRTVVEGNTVTFDGSDSWDTSSDLALLTYEWDFGDGTPGTGTSVENKYATHEYAERGVYIVRLVVRDDDWTDSDTAWFSSELINVTGTADGNGTVSFFYDMGNGTDDNSSSDGDYNFEFQWYFGDGSCGAGNSISHTYDEDGVYVVTLVITDHLGAMSVHTVLVTVLNAPPTADAGSDKSGNEDEEILFQGVGSDPGGGHVDFSWAFGDGHSAPGKDVIHAYTTQGQYTATLTVTDSDGLTATDTCTVTITNVPPIAGLTSDHTTKEGDLIGFYGTTTYDTPSDLPLLTYEWDFGDGTTGTGIEVTHVYADEGTYTVTLKATDDDGAFDTTIMVVPVDNAPPTASIDSVQSDYTPLLPGTNVTFAGSGTDPGINDVLTFTWDFGDGSTSTGSTVTQEYSSAGTYTVELEVSDGDGGTGTATTTVVVEAPTEAAEEAQDVAEEAPAEAFSNPNAQEKILDMLDDLIANLEDDDDQEALKDICKLEKKVNMKVTDEDLKEALLDYLANIKDSLS